MKDKYEIRYSRHHILPKSKGGSNDEDNLVMLKDVTHKAIHTLFENKTPAQQIKEILEMNKTVLQGDFVRDIENILELYGEDIYHSVCKKK